MSIKIKILAVLLLLAFPNLKAQELAPGIDIVGYGYNIFGKFADNTSKKPYQIFKFGANEEKQIGSKMYLVPNGVMLENIGTKEKTVVSGSSQLDYAKSIGVSVGLDVDALTFGASVNAAFSNSWGGSERQYFQTIRDANRTWRISIDQRVDLKTFLDLQAEKDINTMDPAKLFELYGTHVIVNAYLGGRADYTTITKITEEYSEQDISLAASMSYTSVSANASANYNQTQNSILSNTKTSLIVTGGNSEYANDISNFEAYKLWADSIRTMPVLCDFEKGSLIPIWDLANTQTRKNALIAEFSKLAKQYPLPEAFAGIGVGMENNFFYVKSKSNGQYWDLAGYHFYAQTRGGKLDLAGKDVNGNGKQGGDRFFKIIPHATESEYAFFQPQHALEVVDVKDGSKNAGGTYHLCSKGDNNPAQMFKMIEAGEPNTYLIQNKNSGLYFTEKNGQITQETKTEADNQKWVFEEAPTTEMAPPPEGVVYHIERNSSSPVLYWDVRNNGGEGAVIQLFTPNGGNAQAFELLGSGNDYLFMPIHNRGMRADMHPQNDEPLRVWSNNNSAAQHFQLEWAGLPRVYYIHIAGNSTYIGAESNWKNTAGHELKAQSKSNNDLQQWKMNIVMNCALTNRYIGGWLNTISGPVFCNNVDNNNGKAQWIFERVEGTNFVNIKNAADGSLLHIEYGKVEATQIGAGSFSAQWEIEHIPGEHYIRLKNRWKGTFLNVESGNMDCTTIDPAWLSARWEIHYK